MEHMVEHYQLGIDLGPKYICAAVHHEGQVSSVPYQKFGYPSYSMVYYDDSGTPFFGRDAEKHAKKQPSQTVYDIRRVLGLRYSDKEALAYLNRAQNTMVNTSSWEEMKEQSPREPCKFIQVIRGEERVRAPEEIAAQLIQHFTEAARGKIKQPNNGVNYPIVLSVPIWFNKENKIALYEAAKQSNIGLFATIEEPIAAAKAYSLHTTLGLNQKVLVLKFDKESCEASFLEVYCPGKLKIVRKITDTETTLKIFRTKMIEYFIEKIKEQNGLDQIPEVDMPKI